jgi:hypothetical protein
MYTFKKWHDIYFESETLLLACVFENFRRVALENYGQDPSCY